MVQEGIKITNRLPLPIIILIITRNLSRIAPPGRGVTIRFPNDPIRDPIYSKRYDSTHDTFHEFIKPITKSHTLPESLINNSDK